jgi:hypothetical protein
MVPRNALFQVQEWIVDPEGLDLSRCDSFFIFDHLARTREFLDEVTPPVREGRIKYRNNLVEGLENASQAFVGVFQAAISTSSSF